MTTLKLDRPTTIAECQALVTNIPKYCANASFTIAGQAYSATDAVAFVQTVLTAVSATSNAKAAWKDATVAESKVISTDGPTLRGLREVIEVMFSNQTTILSDFMITPRKTPKPLTAAERAAAIAKAKATRAARGTKGKNQKAAISGNVTGVTITPVSAGTSSSVGASMNPSPSAAAATGAAPSASVSSAASSEATAASAGSGGAGSAAGVSPVTPLVVTSPSHS